MNNFRYALLIAVLISLFSGCLSDKTALQKVLTNKNSFDTVGQVYTRLHPCINIVERISHDTTYQHDTAIFTCIDTIGKYIHDTTFQRIKTLATIHDTITTIDGQQELILEGALNERIQTIAGLNANLSDAATINDKLQKKADKYMIWIVFSNILWFILCIFLLWELFRKEIKLPL